MSKSKTLATFTAHDGKYILLKCNKRVCTNVFYPTFDSILQHFSLEEFDIKIVSPKIH